MFPLVSPSEHTQPPRKDLFTRLSSRCSGYVYQPNRWSLTLIMRLTFSIVASVLAAAATARPRPLSDGSYQEALILHVMMLSAHCTKPLFQETL